MILSGEEDSISPAEYGADAPICFYDVLADYYVKVPDSGKPILDLIVQLWSQSFASQIFSLLFHKWVCDLRLLYFEVCYFNLGVFWFWASSISWGFTTIERPLFLPRFSSTQLISLV